MEEKKLSRRHVMGGAVTAGAAGVLGALGPNEAAAQGSTAGLQFPDRGAAQKPPITDVKDKVAYITGGSSGIGLGIAQALHEAGAKVILGNYNDSQWTEALAKFPRNDARVKTIVHDVMERDAWEKKADEIEKFFGPIDILVNNAGVGLQQGIVDGSYNDWDWGMGVNFWGPVYGIKTFVPRMRARGTPAHIVTTTSTSGILVGLPVGIYAVSKIAATGLMEQARADLRNTNIGTSCLVPGMTTTNIARSEDARPDDLRNQGPQQAQRPLVPAGAGGARGGAAPRGAGGAQAAAAPAPVNPLWQRPQDPLMVGRMVVDGILHNDLFIFPAPEYRQGVLARGMAMVESMVDFYPMTDAIRQQEAAGRYFFTDIFVQEIAHRRATRKRNIKGFEG
ncbi:MAG TPA: SDR family NAD(P)-dependent oxidoreductase [Steroidobacteraceae bacterium]|nr:SDR family NAD(P)-dependent oxidoreductase [Steroidobacteraceae bacterium]